MSLLAFGAYWMAQGFVTTYTEEEPIELPEVEITPEEKADLDVRMEEFDAAMQGQGERDSLTLTADEINALLEDEAQQLPFVDYLRVTNIEPDKIWARVSIPAEEVPILGRMAPGRYFNGEAALNVTVQNGRLGLYLEELRLGEQEVPEAQLQQLAGHFAEELNAAPELQAALENIESIDVQDGAIVLRLKDAAETPGAAAPTEGMEAVDAPEQDVSEVVPEMEDTQPLEAPEAEPVAE